MEFKKKTPVLKKNRFPFESASPDTDVLYLPITHTHQYPKPFKTKGNKYKLQKSERFKVKSIK